MSKPISQIDITREINTKTQDKALESEAKPHKHDNNRKVMKYTKPDSKTWCHRIRTTK